MRAMSFHPKEVCNGDIQRGERTTNSDRVLTLHHHPLHSIHSMCE